MTTFPLPDLGEGLSEAEIVAWHVQPGDRVAADQPMVSVETAKAVVEVPAPFAGTVLALHGAPGDVIATGAPLIDFDDGTVVGVIPRSSVELPPEPVADAGRHDGRGATRRARAVPAARALARRLAIDLGSVAGTGRAGLITIDDVLSAAPRAADPATQPLRGLRRAMRASMTLAHAQVALSTVCDDADLGGWERAGGYTPRLIRAIAAAVRVEPALNAWFDPERDARTLQPRLDLAVAVDTADGLIVPVIRDAGTLDPAALAAALAERKAAAHARTLAPEDLRDATFTLSNYGMVAGRYAVPQVVPPAVGILGAGMVRVEPVALGERIVARRRLPLSLSFDHRCVTGGEACRFLAAVIADLQEPR